MPVRLSFSISSHLISLRPLLLQLFFIKKFEIVNVLSCASFAFRVENFPVSQTMKANTVGIGLGVAQYILIGEIYTARENQRPSLLAPYEIRAMHGQHPFLNTGNRH